MSLVADDPRHGTLNGYSNQRCRCDACRAAWAAYTSKLRERRSTTLAPDDLRHGRYTTYSNHKCRCESCRAAWNEWLDKQRRPTSIRKLTSNLIARVELDAYGTVIVESLDGRRYLIAEVAA